MKKYLTGYNNNIHMFN